MGKILAKQIVNVVDLDSDQIIVCEKKFSAPIICLKKDAVHDIVNYNGFIYWVIDSNILDQEGNFRLGVEDMKLTFQEFSGGLVPKTI